jgi:hypothetical protein
VDDFQVDAAGGGVFDDGVLVAAVGPGLGDAGVVDGEVVQEMGATGGVVDAGGGDQDGQEQAEGIGGEVPFAAGDLLCRIEALVGEVDGGGGLDGLGPSARASRPGVSTSGRRSPRRWKPLRSPARTGPGSGTTCYAVPAFREEWRPKRQYARFSRRSRS